MNDRQEAERFAALLEAHAAGRGRHAQAGSEGLGTLLVLAERVGRAGRELPAPAPDFREALRTRLLAEADSLAAESPARGAAGRSRGKVPPQRAARARSGARHSGENRAGVFTGFSSAWRRRLLAMGVGVAVATGSVGGIAIASAGAQPGDPLYNAKRIFESLQLSLSGSPTDQGREYLHLADIRLGEIDALLARPDVDMAGSPTQAYLTQVLGELRTMISDGGTLLVGQVIENGDQTALHALADFLLTERQRVADLSWRLPPSLQSQPPQIVALMDQLSRQLQQAAQARQNDQQGTDSGAQGGSAEQGQGGGVGATTVGPSASASPDTSASASAKASDTPSAGKSGSAGSSSSASPSPSSSIGVSVPVPVIPSIGVTLPGLLGLPEVDLGLGGDEGPTASATPSK